MTQRMLEDRSQMNEIQIIFADVNKRLEFIEGVFEEG